MKFASKLIPTPPSPPSTPTPPSSPDAGQIPAESSIPDASSSVSIPGGDKMPAGVSGAMSVISTKIGEGIPGGNRNITPEQIRAAKDSINLDDYKDENGVVRCPVPKADREKLINDLKKNSR